MTEALKSTFYITDVIKQLSAGAILYHHEVMTVRLYYLVQFADVLVQQGLQRIHFKLHSR